MSTEQQLFNSTLLDGAAEYLKLAVKIAGEVPEGASDPAVIKTAGVLGAGTMGRGIALAFAQTGREVVLVDPSEAALDAAKGHIAKLADRQVKKGKLDDAGREALVGRFSYGTEIAAFSPCDMVVEAVPEILDLKRKVMGEIEAVVRSDALITSNTSTLDIDGIAAGLKDASRFIGTHFFVPAQVNKLLELVPATATSDATLGAVLALAKDLRKQAVIAANGDGFIGNRLFDRFHQEAMYLLEEGALPEEVDNALEAWGMAIGPFRALDLVGNDIPWGVRQQRALRDNPPHQPRVGDALCEAGHYGQKSGKGWYIYDETSPRGRPHGAANVLIAWVSEQLGRTRRPITAEEIVGRCIGALIVEGLAMVEEGRAARASDIDMVYVTGYGFPAAVGGPMRLGETLGNDKVLELARHYGKISGRAKTAWAIPAAIATPEAAE